MKMFLFISFKTYILGAHCVPTTYVLVEKEEQYLYQCQFCMEWINYLVQKKLM